MFEDIKKLGKESLLYGLSTILARFLNFLLMPFYTHYLQPSQYGIVATVFSCIAFFSVIYGFGVNQGYMRYYDEKKSLPSSFNFVFYNSIIFSFIIFFLSGSIANISGIGYENSKLIIYASIILFFDAITLIPFSDLRMKHKVYKFVAIRTISIFSNLILNIILLNHFKNSPYIIDGIFIANIISSLISVTLFFDYFKSIFNGIDKMLLKKIFLYSFPFLPAGLSSIIMQVIDRPIMLKLTSPYWVGIYQANYRLAIFMSLIVTMFDQAWRPFVIEKAKDEKAPEIFSKVFSYFTFILASLWLILAFFIEDIAKFNIGRISLINSNYWQGLYIIPIIMGAYIFNGIYINFLASIIIKKNTYSIMIATMAGATLNIIFNLLLIPKYNISGAAFSVLISYISMALIIYYFARKTYFIPYEFGKFFKLIFITLLTFFIYNYYKFNFSYCQLLAFKTLLILAFFTGIYFIKYFTKEELFAFRNYLSQKLKLN